MSETEPSRTEEEPAEQDLLEQRWWRNALSAPWLFTYLLVAAQLLTFPFVYNFMPSLWIYVFVAAGLSLTAVVPIWWVVIHHWSRLGLGLVVMFVEGIILGFWVPSGSLMFLLPILVGGTVAIPLAGISCFWGAI